MTTDRDGMSVEPTGANRLYSLAESRRQADEIAGETAGRGLMPSLAAIMEMAIGGPPGLIPMVLGDSYGSTRCECQDAGCMNETRVVWMTPDERELAATRTPPWPGIGIALCDAHRHGDRL